MIERYKLALLIIPISMIICSQVVLAQTSNNTAPQTSNNTAAQISNSTSQIIGGSSEDNANFPWAVNVGPGCGGVLIAPQFLTAAHCLAQTGPFMPTVTFTRGTTNYFVSSYGYTFHDDYNSKTHENDIALVHLTREFPPESQVRPAELPLGSGFVGQQGYLANGNVEPGKIGVYRAPIVGDSVSNTYFDVNSPTADLCKHDSGSGFMMNGGGKYFVVGIASQSANINCIPPAGNDEAKITDVFYYNAWIRSETGMPAPPPLGNQRDILWRHTNGTMLIWFLRHMTIFDQFSPTYYGQHVGNDWGIILADDLDGNNVADILWRHTGGTLALWKMHLGNLIRDTYPSWQNSGQPTGNDWKVVGVGNFNGDEIKDILWQHTSGNLSIWYLNSDGQYAGDIRPTSYVNGEPHVIDPDCPGLQRWRIISIADFNGDRYSDILWRNKCGTLSIWLNVYWYYNRPVFANDGSGAASLAWQIAGTADFNFDRKSDILWRNRDGTVTVWLMNGWIAAGDGRYSVPLDWQIQKAGDFSGDGSSDILWRHTNGQLAIWVMYGGLNFAQAFPGALDNAWSVTDVAEFGRHHELYTSQEPVLTD